MPYIHPPLGPSGTTPVSTKGRVLYDSGVVAAGAIIASPVLDLTYIETLEVIADNLAGAAFRALTMDQYLDDGVTLIDAATPLRNVAPGARPHGIIGPNPPGGTSGVTVLYDAVSGVNAALDTGPLITEDFDALFVESRASAGTHTLTSNEVRDDNTQDLLTVTPAANAAAGAWGTGVGSVGLVGTAVIQAPVPRRVQYQASAAGAGNTVRLRVLARGRPPGTYAVQLVLPTKAKFTLAAAGAGNGRLTIIGR